MSVTSVLLLRRMNQRRSVYFFLTANKLRVLSLTDHSNNRALLFCGSVCKSSVRLGHLDGQTAWPRWEMRVKCLSQGHNGRIHQLGFRTGGEPATFRLLARRSNHSYVTEHISSLFLTWVLFDSKTSRPFTAPRHNNNKFKMFLTVTTVLCVLFFVLCCRNKLNLMQKLLIHYN